MLHTCALFSFLVLFGLGFSTVMRLKGLTDVKGLTQSM